MNRTEKFLVLGLLLAVAGCSAAATQQKQPTDQSVAPAPTPRIVLVTPAPTAKPTPLPTVEPTTSPEIIDGTAKDDPVVDPLVNYLAFLNRSASWLDAMSKSADHSGTLLQHGKWRAGLRAINHDQTIEQSFINWAAANPPDACYKHQFDVTLGTAKHVSNSDLAIARWLRAFPYGSNRDYKYAMRELKASRHGLNQIANFDSVCI